MIEALKMADTKLSDVDSFLATLLAEHDAPGVRAQLQNLWIANVRLIHGDEDDAAPAGGAVGAGGAAGARRNAAPTPPDSLKQASTQCGN